MANIFVNDPLLGSMNQPANYEQQLNEIARMQQQLEAQRRQMEQASRQMQEQPAQSRTPLWDEIERITSEMTDSEFDAINKSDDFQESQNTVMAILNREYMRMMRPIVEQTKDGREALENHLALLRSKRKQAAKDAERNMALFNEYTEKYSDKTFAEFIQLKNKKSCKSKN
ncbi:MAG: hypothetical protein ACI4C3_01060 [Bacteroides sp.]